MKVIAGCIFLLLFSITTWANVIETAGEISLSAKSIDDPTVGRRIQFCRNYQERSVCELFPEKVDFLFTGSTSDWDTFYNYCLNSEHLNNLVLTTQIVQTFALMPALGFFKAIALESGIAFLTPEVAYPDVSREAAHRMERMTSYMLLRNGKKKTLKNSKLLLGLQKVLKACSVGFRNHLVQSKRGNCMAGCHSSGSRKETTGTIRSEELYDELEAYTKYNRVSDF